MGVVLTIGKKLIKGRMQRSKKRRAKAREMIDMAREKKANSSSRRY